MRKVLLAALAVIVIAVGLPEDAPAQDSSMMCLQTCMETYGTDKKHACALQCGYGTGTSATGGQQTGDCGTIYKQCLSQCGSDGNCKNACRKQRTTCY